MPMMFPAGANEVVDVLRMKAVTFDAAGKLYALGLRGPRSGRGAA